MTGKPTNAEIADTIRLEIADVLQRRGHPVAPFDEETLFALGQKIEDAAGHFAAPRWW